ncbi:MAG: DNA circularization N-terminal domain-containing protein [Roseomonas sp.]|nr:DNA circularization N-terminal domain-containing protein [Roseomonas sp.]MCA3419982.1 DNA circularization N-terminal domain-containing protein [Roseomonas sp.]
MSEALTSIAGLASALPWVGANLRPGALRGLLFYVQTSEDTSARRWVTHEFPGRDEAWHEDLGQKTRSFSIEGLLVGPDVVLQSRAFARAAADPEPATLLHPWLGAMRVVVLDCRISHDVNQARVARVSLRVEKAGTKPAPVLGIDSLGEVLDEADRLLTAAQSIYAEYRFMRAAADFIVQSFKASVLGIAGAIEGALSNAGLVGGAAGSVSALSTMNDAAIVSDTAVPLAVASAARDVSALAGGRAALTRGADAAPQGAFAALDALNAQELVKAPIGAATTPARAQLVAANEGLAVLAAAIFAGEFARAAAAVPWASRDEAMAARDKVSDALAAAADRVAAAGWDAVWQRLVALRAASAADLAERAAPLPRIKRLELPGVMPATLIAYRLDGDSLSDVFGRGAALSARNRLRHPGFVPAAQPIEVLV